MSNPTNAVSWAEIPVTDMERAKRFYGAVMQAPLVDNPHGPNPMADFAHEGGVSGHIYPGRPAASGTGSTIHLTAAGALEDVMERVREAGGTVASPIIDIPVGRFFYAQDLDGNSLGFFEHTA